MVFLALLAFSIGGLAILALVVVGLVEAPWPVLLVGLLTALYGLQRLLTDSYTSGSLSESQISAISGYEKDSFASSAPAVTAKADPASEDTNADVELIYRGIRYHLAKPDPALTESPSTTEQPDTVVEGVYRGHRWQRHIANQAPPAESTHSSDEVVYRGHKVQSHHQ